MRRSCNTSKVVFVALVTSMYRSGIGNDSSQAHGVWLLVQRDDGECNSLKSTRSRFGLQCHPEMSLMVEIRLFLLEDLHVLRLVQEDHVLRWMFSELISPDNFTFPSAIRNVKFSLFFSAITSYAVSLRAWISDASKFSSSSMSATKMSPFQIPSAYNAYPRNMPSKTCLPNWWILDKSLAEIGWYSIIEAKKYHRSFEWIAKSPFIRCVPVRQAVLNVSQIAVTLRGICPPFFVQDWLQQYCRSSFLDSAYRSFSNDICFWTVRCRRTMIPG